MGKYTPHLIGFKGTVRDKNKLCLNYVSQVTLCSVLETADLR